MPSLTTRSVRRLPLLAVLFFCGAIFAKAALTVGGRVKIIANDGGPLDGFSTIMAFSEDVLAVGMPGADIH